MDKVMMVAQILWWHTDARQRMEMKNDVASPEFKPLVKAGFVHIH